MALAMCTRMDGTNMVTMIFGIDVQYCDKLQLDRYIKCMEEWEAAKHQQARNQGGAEGGEAP